ncbi:kinesin-like protein KIN-5B [Quercus suber]|uniref:kinesin-like protein KIN-5B n=1 Tax=Quercus suber TaxID=58331 RepID=UPI0032DEF9B4
MLDHEIKKEIDSMTTLCLDQIKLIQETHGTSISDIRSQAEKCLVKDYLVDNHTSTTPKKRVIVVPSLASIEEMRTPAYEISEKGVKLALTESKIPHLQRTPFAYLN